MRGHQLFSSYEASLNFLASSGMRITVHYIVEKWPEGHYHHCFPSHVVKCGKNDVFYIHSYYNFVHFYAHFIFYIELCLLKVDDSKGFIPVKVATLLHSRDATNFSPMAHQTMLNRIPESCLCRRSKKNSQHIQNESPC